ncbi:hypothetical protein BUB20358_06282 [Burkholderia ubonensis]|nr:hypothetical protein BUB20358_06282 [Burkholderia ubonensis]
MPRDAVRRATPVRFADSRATRASYAAAMPSAVRTSWSVRRYRLPFARARRRSPADGPCGSRSSAPIRRSASPPSPQAKRSMPRDAVRRATPVQSAGLRATRASYSAAMPNAVRTSTSARRYRLPFARAHRRSPVGGSCGSRSSAPIRRAASPPSPQAKRSMPRDAVRRATPVQSAGLRATRASYAAAMPNAVRTSTSARRYRLPFARARRRSPADGSHDVRSSARGRRASRRPSPRAIRATRPAAVRRATRVRPAAPCATRRSCAAATLNAARTSRRQPPARARCGRPAFLRPAPAARARAASRRPCAARSLRGASRRRRADRSNAARTCR